MCGIAGIVSSGERSELAAHITAMCDRLAHRGPDGYGSYLDPDLPIALGHRRLSIVELSPLGAQPMSSPDGRYHLTFNGEIYNFRAIRSELEQDFGSTFRGGSDTEVMLEAFRQRGVERALRDFEGMFAFALWDRQARTLTLGRDRLGEKPLYYGWHQGQFLFASELAAFWGVPNFNPIVRAESVARFFEWNYVPTPATIFEGIFKLPQGHFLTLSWAALLAPSSAPAPIRYWSLPKSVQGFSGSLNEGVSTLEAVLVGALKDQMLADVPVGAFLSGGIDSSLIVALMQKISAQPVRTFAIGFHDPAYDEAPFARKVAKHLGTDHHELYLDEAKMLEIVPQLAARFSEPFADSSQIPSLLVAALARQHVTVVLSGDGGDELFGGYPRYQWAERIWGGLRYLPRSLRAILGSALHAIPPALTNQFAAAICPYLPHSFQIQQPGQKVQRVAELLREVTGFEQLYRRMVTHWPHGELLVPGGCPDVRSGLATELISPSESLRFMVEHDINHYLPEDILQKVDRASMAHSLESRVPLLNHRVVETALSFPREFRLHGGHSKIVAKKLLARYVPTSLTERPKRGFGVPLTRWLRGPLRPWAEDLLSEQALGWSGLLDPKPIRALWGEYSAGRTDAPYLMWDVLMFQAWWGRWMKR